MATSAGGRHELATPQGQSMVSILLFEDLLIVPRAGHCGFRKRLPNAKVSKDRGRLKPFRRPLCFYLALRSVATSAGGRHELATPQGQSMVSILLFEDLLIVPLLAIVAKSHRPRLPPNAKPRTEAV